MILRVCYLLFLCYSCVVSVLNDVWSDVLSYLCRVMNGSAIVVIVCTCFLYYCCFLFLDFYFFEFCFPDRFYSVSFFCGVIWVHFFESCGLLDG